MDDARLACARPVFVARDQPVQHSIEQVGIRRRQVLERLVPFLGRRCIGRAALRAGRDDIGGGAGKIAIGAATDAAPAAPAFLADPAGR